MGGLSVTHWLIVLVVVVLIFGARRLPDTARGLARSLRIFKSELGDKDGDKDKGSVQPSEQQPVERGDLATWPGLEASGPASKVVPPRSMTAEPAPDERKAVS